MPTTGIGRAHKRWLELLETGQRVAVHSQLREGVEGGTVVGGNKRSVLVRVDGDHRSDELRVSRLTGKVINGGADEIRPSSGVPQQQPPRPSARALPPAAVERAAFRAAASLLRQQADQGFDPRELVRELQDPHDVSAFWRTFERLVELLGARGAVDAGSR